MFSTLFSNGLLAILAGLLAFTLPILFVWQRVGTLGFFLDRIWRLAGGRTELYDEALSSIDREHAQIEYFNYKYKLKAARMADIHQIHDFMKQHEVSIERLCDVRRWFSLSPEPALSAPNRAWQITATVAGLIFYLVMSASFGAIAFNKTYLRFTDTGEYFLTDGTTVSGEVFNGQDITLSDCPAVQQHDPSGDRQRRIDTLCNAYGQGQFKAMVERSLVQQRIVLGWFGLMAAVFAFLCARYVGGSVLAKALCEKLGQPPRSDADAATPALPTAATASNSTG